MTEHEIFFGFYGAAFGAIVGALVAFLLTRYSLQNEQRKKLIRIHEIINDEFYRIYVYAGDGKEFITSQLDTEKTFKEHFDWVKHEAVRGRSPVIFVLPNFRFLLWDAIISSGSLINLESDEIQLINSAHDDMIALFKMIKKDIEDFHNKFSIVDENLNLKKEQKKVTEEDLQIFLMGIYARLVQLEKIFDNLVANISWIKKEFSSEQSKNEDNFYDIRIPDWIRVPFPRHDEPIRKTPI